MPKPKRRLTNIKTLEVSLVDKGAVKRPFLIMKAEGSPFSFMNREFLVPMSFREILRHTEWMDEEKAEEFFAQIQEVPVLKELLEGFSKLEPEILGKSLDPLSKSEKFSDFLSVLKEGMPDDFMDQQSENFETDLNKLGTESHGLLRTMVNMLNDFFNRGVKPGDSTFMPEEPTMVEKTLTTEEISALPQNVQDHIKVMADNNATLTTQVAEAGEVQKSLDTANADLKTVKEELSTIKKASESTDPMEGMTEVQKAYFKDKDNEVAVLKKAADKVETAEFIAKADGFKLPEVKGSEFGPVLKEINAKCSKETTAAVMKALSDASDVIKKKELLNSIGADGEPNLSDADTALDNAAKEIQKADPSLTHAVAVVKALEANPKLYS